MSPAPPPPTTKRVVESSGTGASCRDSSASCYEGCFAQSAGEPKRAGDTGAGSPTPSCGQEMSKTDAPAAPGRHGKRGASPGTTFGNPSAGASATARSATPSRHPRGCDALVDAVAWPAQPVCPRSAISRLWSAFGREPPLDDSCTRSRDPRCLNGWAAASDLGVGLVAESCRGHGPPASGRSATVSVESSPRHSRHAGGQANGADARPGRSRRD
jgi:hypothetical protein